MMTLSDARAAVLAVRSVSAKPIFVTFTCDQNGRSISGTDITAALLVLQGMGIDAFGLNCSAGPDQMLPQLRRLREYARIPLIAKPNAGMPTIVNGKAVYDCTPEQFTALVPDMLASGVMIFGGWSPVKIALAAILFGFFRALGNVYSGFDFLLKLNMPSVVYNMLPYFVSLIVLAFTSKKSRAPKAEGIPYDKGSR